MQVILKYNIATADRNYPAGKPVELEGHILEAMLNSGNATPVDEIDETEVEIEPLDIDKKTTKKKITRKKK